MTSEKEQSSIAPVALLAVDVPPRQQVTFYPQPFAARVAGREKRILGDRFGLKNFGVNLTRLSPGAASSIRHAHSKQDEFVYVVQGNPVLVTNAGETVLMPGMCAGFRGGSDDAHHLVNRTAVDVFYLEVGDRTAGDAVVYPDDDLHLVRGADGKVAYLRKDGTAY